MLTLLNALLGLLLQVLVDLFLDRARNALKAFLIHKGPWPLLAGVGNVTVFTDERPTVTSRVPGRVLAPRARPRPGSNLTVELADGVTMRLAWIEPGSFLMGSDDEGHLADEAPRHRVRIERGYWLGVVPVTQEQYEAVTGYNPSRCTGDPRRPVERVSVDDCLRFCRLLSADLGCEVRLPTEAEWEYACRAGSTSAYPCGDTDRLSEHAWFAANSGGTTQPVGKKKANPWGLHDMMGNVAEWCLDGYGPYSAEDVSDPCGGPAATQVLRGGSWRLPAWACRSTCRGAQAPTTRSDENGFRVVLTVD